MRVQFAANASFLIQLESGVRVLTDPWYSDGIYYGSWYNYPPLSSSQRDHFLGCRPDFIYISHLHPDHLDPTTLALFPRSTPILIGKLPHPHLARAIRRLGFSDVRELPLGEILKISDVEFAILPQFEGTGDGTIDDVGYALDTSLFVRDVNGESLLNAVDNPIKPRDAGTVLDQFGSIDVAILPYSGASFYPHAFPGIPAHDKLRRKDALRQARLQALVDIARALNPSWVIPAAGSYVMGGRIAPYTAYLHQATPIQLKEFWERRSGMPDILRPLGPCDSLVLPGGSVDRHVGRNPTDFTEQDRVDYAKTLASKPMPQDSVRIPADFMLPWRRLLEKARRNLWLSQQRLGLFPNADIEIKLNTVDLCPVHDQAGQSFRFALDREDPYPALSTVAEHEDRLFVRFTLDSSLMLMLLLGGAVWNNVEIGALVECERHPDTYTPTIHSLMSFFLL
jgi:UDP-MurNAc hydroxylase